MTHKPNNIYIVVASHSIENKPNIKNVLLKYIPTR